MSVFNLLTKDSSVKVGDAAPTPISLDENGEPLNFADVYAKGITLVYFYPRADTPGCTKQACGLRDAFESLQNRHLQIIGVSGDSPDRQHKFKERYRLPFSLAADQEGVVATAFGVPTVLGLARRQSFLIWDGKIVWSKSGVSPITHVQDVHAALDRLMPAAPYVPPDTKIE